MLRKVFERWGLGLDLGLGLGLDFCFDLERWGGLRGVFFGGEPVWYTGFRGWDCQASANRHISHAAQRLGWSLPRSKDFKALGLQGVVCLFVVAR